MSRFAFQTHRLSYSSVSHLFLKKKTCVSLCKRRCCHNNSGFALRGIHMDVTTSSKVRKLSQPQHLLDTVQIFIFDCDGVIWKGDSLIAGAKELITQLKDLGKRVYFITNNSTKSRASYLKKFRSLGLDNVDAEEILSSSYAAAAYLTSIHFQSKGKKVYVIGEKGIEEELEKHHIAYLGGESDKDKVPDMRPGGKVVQDSQVGAVVVGFDRYINYYKIQYAQLCLSQNSECLFIATNLDSVTHLTDAQEWAGNGAMVGAIRGCTQKEPIVVGKPSPLLINDVIQKHQLEPYQICMF
ncbi:Phosphoglycolate phosphatase 1B, chloroplastic [Galdieria sulphuraria]|nr:Phosphoglycolate phosphatase 1B, chloroplastic [Galdieria sulphuraria]